MKVTSVVSEIDPMTGLGIDHVYLENTRFDRVTVKQVSGEDVKIIAEESDGYEWDYNVGMTDRRTKILSYYNPRRDLDDDLQDALLAGGYSVMGSDLNV